MIFRFAKESDAPRLAQLQSDIKDVNDLGIFVQMGGDFLKTYYKLVLTDPYIYCLCAEDENGLVVGYCFNILDCRKHHARLYSNKFSLAFSAITTLIKKPSLFKALWIRYKSLKNNDGQYAAAEGARGGYWGWDPKNKSSEMSFELHERSLAIAKLLNVKELHFEVDNDNKKVLKFHKLNGAQVDKIVTLPDGRVRSLMHYDVPNHKFLIEI